MKKTILLLALSITFFGCSKKSNNQNPTISIVGKWYTTHTIDTDYGTNPHEVVTVDFNHTDYIQFNSDGTGTRLLGGDTMPFTYSIANNDISVLYAQVPQANHITVKTLTASSLVILESYSYQGVLEETLETQLSK